MNESLSRLLLAVEAVVLLLPLTLLYGVLAMIAIGGAVNGQVPSSLPLAGTAASGAGLVAVWYALLRAVVGGIASLRALHPAWMRVAGGIAVWVVAAWCLAGAGALSAGGSAQPLFDDFLLGLYGLPALPSFVHLSAERLWRARGAAHA